MVSIIRGKTPDNISQKCHQLCADYLGGNWKSITSLQLTIKRLTGGFTNQMYHCSLPTHLTSLGSEPNQVVIKLYGIKHFKTNDKHIDDDERLTDGIISIIVARSELAPNIYGIFPSGQIMQYIEHNRFERVNQTDQTLVKELAQKLATFHSLKVPIKRNTNDWYLSIIDICYKTAFERFPNLEQLLADNNLKVLNCETLLNEIIWIKSTVNSLNMPKVFCHNDFRGSNIMVRTQNAQQSNRLLLCDLENARYGYRGVDFACIFAEWERDLSDFRLYCKCVTENLDPTLFNEFPAFPSDIPLKVFICEYLSESLRIYGDQYVTDNRNSVHSILSETKLFSLLIKLFSVLAFFQQNEGPNGLEFDKVLTLKFADYLFKHYFHLKTQFSNEAHNDSDSYVINYS